MDIDAQLSAALSDLAGCTDAAKLEAWRIAHISTKAIKDLMAPLAAAPKDQKRELGQKLNAAKEALHSAYEQQKLALAAAPAAVIDVTEPGRRPAIGNRHILMKVIDELTELFGRMGFALAEGPEVEDEFHNFIALNIPESHPARDPLDNFYLVQGSGFRVGEGSGFRVQGSVGNADTMPPTVPESSEPNPERRTVDAPVFSSLNPEPRTLNPQQLLLLRTQTSTVQIRVMETQKPPIRVVIPGRVYRPDTTDQTHLPMFHQLEALVVDRDVTMVDLKSTIMQFVHAYFGPETKVRFRPSFFPFTEPSAEVDVWFEDKQRWIELGGCGMVHPNVLKNVNIDPETHSGWAFGLGIERIAMRKYGISDIRSFVENDIRFLRQF
jgi:phenylalanyl-tRNA synthetase alpha chain